MVNLNPVITLAFPAKGLQLLGPVAQEAETYLLTVEKMPTNKSEMYRSASVQEMLNQFVAQMAEYSVTFSLTKNQLTLSNPKLGALAQAFVTDLLAMKIPCNTLFIDQYDNLQETENTGKFWQKVVEELQNKKHAPTIVLIARGYNLVYWNKLLTDGHVVMRGKEAPKLLQDKKPLLKIRLFGVGEVLANGVKVHFEGPLVRNIFWFFIVRKMVTRDEIFETFWPDLSIKEATNVFHVTKRKMNEALGLDLMAYWDAFYRLNPDVDFDTDLDHFYQAVEKADFASNHEAVETWAKEAVSIHKVELLHGTELLFAREARKAALQSYVRMLALLGKLYLEQSQHMLEGSPERKRTALAAINFYLRALRETPVREDLHREVLTLYWQNGMPGDFALHYFALHTDLEKTLKVVPDKKTQELVSSLSGHSTQEVLRAGRSLEGREDQKGTHDRSA